MTAATIALFWALAAWALVGRDGRRLVCGFFASLPFMSFAVVPVDFLGGLSLTPAPVLGTLLVLRTALAGRGARVMLTDALLPRRMLLLTLFWAVAVVITLFMPAILAGRVLVIPVRAAWMGPVPLFPSAQNLSQLGYLTVSVLLALAFAVILREPEGRRRAFGALCLGGWVAVATGLLDYASLRLPLEAVLAPFRTASYALLVSDQALGGKRVVGLMPEASSFGLLCLGFLSLLCFLRRGLDGERRAGLPVLLGLLAVCVWLSTSSAAYVGLALLGIVLAVDWVWRAAGLRRGAPGRHGLAGEAWVAGGALAAVMLVLVVFPAGPERLVAGFDAMVLQKPGSSSYLGAQPVDGDLLAGAPRLGGARGRGGLDPRLELDRGGGGRHGAARRGALPRVRGADAGAAGAAGRRRGRAAARRVALGVAAAFRRRPDDRLGGGLRAVPRLPLRARGGGLRARAGGGARGCPGRGGARRGIAARPGGAP